MHTFRFFSNWVMLTCQLFVIHFAAKLQSSCCMCSCLCDLMRYSIVACYSAENTECVQYRYFCTLQIHVFPLRLPNRSNKALFLRYVRKLRIAASLNAHSQTITHIRCRIVPSVPLQSFNLQSTFYLLSTCS